MFHLVICEKSFEGSNGYGIPPVSGQTLILTGRMTHASTDKGERVLFPDYLDGVFKFSLRDQRNVTGCVLHQRTYMLAGRRDQAFTD